jgi:hypothetical protein
LRPRPVCVCETGRLPPCCCVACCLLSARPAGVVGVLRARPLKALRPLHLLQLFQAMTLLQVCVAVWLGVIPHAASAPAAAESSSLALQLSLPHSCISVEA